MVRSACVALLLLSGAGCDWLKKKPPPDAKTKSEILAEQRKNLQQACASSATYDRLKELVFDEAIRIRNADPVNLDTLATHSVVRMEAPVAKSRDEMLNVTVCTGRFILELPPGAEAAFGGERRIAADIEYAAQAAADGSGLVYQMSGAEPVIYKLAAFDLRGQSVRPAVRDRQQYAEGSAPAKATPMPESLPPAEPRRAQPAAKRAAELKSPAPAARPAGQAKPSFNCKYGRTAGEKAVCGSTRLAGLDRSMSSLYYSALSDASPAARGELRQSRDRFLAYRDRCRTDECIADAYVGRMEEIRDIMASQ